MRLKFVRLGEALVVKDRRSGEVMIPYVEILTAERLRSRRGLDLHLKTSMRPVRVRCRRRDMWTIEDGLRIEGVRVVDCWGAIIAPTLLDFEEELAREPVIMRQSSDNA